MNTAPPEDSDEDPTTSFTTTAFTTPTTTPKTTTSTTTTTTMVPTSSTPRIEASPDYIVDTGQLGQQEPATPPQSRDMLGTRSIIPHCVRRGAFLEVFGSGFGWEREPKKAIVHGTMRPFGAGGGVLVVAGTPDPTHSRRQCTKVLPPTLAEEHPQAFPASSTEHKNNIVPPEWRFPRPSWLT
ncbi:unnamed protein product [Arctogadus glacialis]